MNQRIEHCLYQAGLTAQGCWDELDDYARQGIEKFAELIVIECASICEINGQSYKHSFTPAKARLAESTSNHCAVAIKEHFGVEE